MGGGAGTDRGVCLWVSSGRVRLWACVFQSPECGQPAYVRLECGDPGLCLLHDRQGYRLGLPAAAAPKGLAELKEAPVGQGCCLLSVASSELPYSMHKWQAQRCGDVVANSTQSTGQQLQLQPHNTHCSRSEVVLDDLENGRTGARFTRLASSYLTWSPKCPKKTGNRTCMHLLCRPPLAQHPPSKTAHSSWSGGIH